MTIILKIRPLKSKNKFFAKHSLGGYLKISKNYQLQRPNSHKKTTLRKPLGSKKSKYATLTISKKHINFKIKP